MSTIQKNNGAAQQHRPTGGTTGPASAKATAGKPAADPVSGKVENPPKAPPLTDALIRKKIEENVRALGKGVKRPTAAIGEFAVSEVNSQWAMIERGSEMLAIRRSRVDEALKVLWEKFFNEQ